MTNPFIRHRRQAGDKRTWAFFSIFLTLVSFLSSCTDRYGYVPPATDYNDEPAYFDSSDLEKQVAEQVLVLFQRMKVAQEPREDRALDAAARNLAVTIKKQGLDLITTTDNSRITAAMAEMGITDSTFRSVLLNVVRADDAGPKIEENLGKDLENGRYTHFGVGTARALWPPALVVAVIFTRKPTALNPFPRSVLPGEEIALSGHVLMSGENLSVLVQGPKETRTYHPPILPGGFFTQNLSFDQAGASQVEVMLESETGPEVAALFPVRVEGGGKATESEPKPLERVEITSVAQARQRLMDLVNEERAKNDLIPVVIDEKLNRIAQKYAEEMERTGLVAHISQKSGDIADRAKAAGLRFQRISENIAQNQTIEQVHESLMSSPSHRENILDRQVDWIGVGVAFTKDENQVFVVENFVRYQAGQH